MKKQHLFAVILVFSSTIAFLKAQSPDRFNYQAVAKNANNTPITGAIAVRITILNNTTNGPEVYKETHNATADNSGVFSLQVGGGTPQGTLWSNINWGSGSKFLKVEIQPNGAPGFVTMGTPQQLVSVPYAQYATNTASWTKNGTNVFNTADNIGVGIATPGKKLQVHQGDLRISDALGYVDLQGGNNLLLKDKSAKNFASFYADATPNKPRLELLGRNNWNPADTEGDFQIGDGSNKFKIGLALGGSGAGNANIYTSGNILNLGQGTNYNMLRLAGGSVEVGSTINIKGENGKIPSLHLYQEGSQFTNAGISMFTGTKYVQFDNYYWRNANPPDPDGGFVFFGGFHHLYGENINLFVDKDGIRTGFGADRIKLGHKGLHNFEVVRENAADVFINMRPENTNKQRAAKFAGNCLGIEVTTLMKDATETEHLPALFYVNDVNFNILNRALVSARIDNTSYKVLGDGIVSTVVKGERGTNHIMACPEAPEVLFQDFGQGQLKDGKASIALDPIFTNNIHVDDQHPLRVFIQLRGDCKGVYVENETAKGFEVIELQGGKSNVKFTWFVTANRKDEERGGHKTQYQNNRFKTIEWVEKATPATTVLDKPK